MKLVRVNEGNVFVCQCKGCQNPCYFSPNYGFADVEGDPFKAYYCDQCADKLGASAAKA